MDLGLNKEQEMFFILYLNKFKNEVLTKIFFRLAKCGDRGKLRHVSEIEHNARRKKIE